LRYSHADRAQTCCFERALNRPQSQRRRIVFFAQVRQPHLHGFVFHVFHQNTCRLGIREMPLRTGHALSQLRWIATLTKHVGVVVRFQDDQIGQIHRVLYLLIRYSKVGSECDGPVTDTDYEPHGTHRVVRYREARYIDIPEAVRLSHLENGRGFLVMKSCGTQDFLVGKDGSSVPCCQVTGCLAVVAVLVRDQYRGKLTRRDPFRPEMLFECVPSQSGLKEEGGTLGPQQERIAGTAARESPKNEQIGAFGDRDDGGEMVPGGLALRQRLPTPVHGSIMMGQTISDVRRGRRMSGVSRMTYVITESCIGVKDGSCADVCPVECIHTMPGDHMYFIDPDECIDCGVCVPECPVDAIYPEEEVPEKHERFTLMNAEYFELNADRFR
jgi:ferredoxin